ncbi:MAG: tetratricopeptide repeat protein [Planctomycetes bacterium]|nr:tetratricopeptide repeat protein [Planctomycetota bacterium]
MKKILLMLNMAVIAISTPLWAQETPPEIYAVDEFAPEKDPAFMKLIEKSELKQKAVDALKDSGGNWRELADAVKYSGADLRDDMLWLITVMRHLDRLEMTKDILIEHVSCAHQARALAKYAISDDVFRNFIVNYALPDAQEPYIHVSSWRKSIFDIGRPLIKDTFTDTAKEVNKWVSENLKQYDSMSGRFAQMPDPLTIYNCGGGDAEDIAIFTTALLRTICVPAKIKASWVEFYDGANWVPLYPLDPASLGNTQKDEAAKKEYETPGGIKVVLMQNGQNVQPSQSNLSIAEYQDGFWAETREYSPGQEWVSLKPGRYLVMAGTRNGNGDAYVFTKQVFVRSGVGTIMEVPLDTPPEFMSASDRVRRTVPQAPEFVLPGRDGNEFDSKPVIRNKNLLIMFFTLAQEPSIRMLPMIENCLGTAEKTNTSVLAILTDPDAGEKFFADDRVKNTGLTVLFDANQETAKKFFPDFEKVKEAGLPSVVLLEKGTGKVLYWKDGYNMGVAEELNFVMALSSGLEVAQARPEARIQEVEYKEVPDYAGLADAAYGARDYDKAIELYLKALELYPRAGVVWYNLACTYALKSEKEKAFEALEKSVLSGYKEFDWMRQDKDLESLHSDPMFEKILTGK